MTYSQLLGEWKPTIYKTPTELGFVPAALTGEQLEALSPLFGKQGEKQLSMFGIINEATAAGVGIKTHEIRGKGCFYNNFPDVTASINKKLKKWGFKFSILHCEPANKPNNGDSWLYWIVIDDTKGKPTHRQGESK
ncbi:hypothetical protein [Vibrio alfacsensis]|uniref:hypothetical protein n=1 Tax=Vibrio alfacsensis TaxID=1074311 RepID=UPI0040694EC5